MQVEDLYTVKDVQRVRELLLKQQDNLDACTLLEMPPKQACLDHLHDDEQLVRGVLHRQVNSYIGKLENNFVRMLAWWYPNDLPTFLEQAADYLRKEPLPYRHPNWQKKIRTLFNSCNASQQNQVLVKLGSTEGSNPAKRKELFSKVILDRTKGFVYIRDIINQTKES